MRVVVLGLLVGGCSNAAVATFEDFYAATAQRDAATVRTMLCPEAQKQLASTSDAELAEALQPRRVILRATLQAEGTGTAVIAVEDTTGQTTTVALEKSPSGPRG